MGTPETRDIPTISQTLIRNQNMLSRSRLASNLPYAWTTNDSVFSSDIDRWLGVHRSFQNNTTTEQRSLNSRGSTLTALYSTLYWYIAAFLLQIFNLGALRTWRCTSSFFNTLDQLVSQVSSVYGRLRSRLQSYAQEQATRELFAGAMEVVLMMYALGFLLLSMYQASEFQQF